MGAVPGRSTRSLAVMRFVVVLGIAAAVAAAGVHAAEKCSGSDTKYFNQALIFHLEKRGVPYRVSTDVICVEERYATEFASAQQQLDSYFNELAYKLDDACEERALVDWAQKAGLRFDVLPVRNSRNEPAGNMFFLRSFTREELEHNRAKFDSEAPKDSTCKSKK